MEFQYVDIFFQVIVFLFAISVHESAHAWMADRCGDPTAKMLGRITLNPLKHIDPFGTVILPAITIFSGFGILGWAKPTPVTPENFSNKVKGDILTTVAGPVSNFLLVLISLALLSVIYLATPLKHMAVINILRGGDIDRDSLLLPVAWLDRKSTRLNSSHIQKSRMPSSA